MTSSHNNSDPVIDNEDFVTLIQVAREDAEIRNKLLSILELDSFNRKSVLNTWLDQLKLQQAPKQFMGALACLIDDGIAEKAIKIIQEQ